jgi:hypothetical protein
MPFAVAGGACFKCGRAGKVLTKRGAAAARYLNELRSRPASDLKVGDVVRLSVVTPNGVGDAWSRVTSISTVTERKVYGWGTTNGVTTEYAYEVGDLVIVTNLYEQTVKPGTMFRVKTVGEEAARTWALALAYQDTLTQTGKPRKAARTPKQENPS